MDYPLEKIDDMRVAFEYVANAGGIDNLDMTDKEQVAYYAMVKSVDSMVLGHLMRTTLPEAAMKDGYTAKSYRAFLNKPFNENTTITNHDVYGSSYFLIDYLFSGYNPASTP